METLISFLIYLGLMKKPEVKLEPQPVPVVLVATTTPKVTSKTEKKIIIKPVEKPVIEVQKPKETVIIKEEATTPPIEVYYFDEIRPIQWDVKYERGTSTVKVTIEAPVYTYGFERYNNLKCYLDNVEIKKMQDTYTFESKGEGNGLQCRITYMRPTIGKEETYREYAPVDFIKIKNMLQ